MATQEFLLPDVGEGLEAGTIVQWLVSPGDAVTVDQIIVEIETDKAVVEIPAPVTGTLASQGGKAGATLPVGSVLATFETDTLSTAPATAPSTAIPGASSAAAQQSATTQADAPISSTNASSSTAQPLTSSKRILASPATRKYARNHKIDLSLINGSGSRGQITQKDIEKFLASGGDTVIHNATATEASADLRATSDAASKRNHTAAPAAVRTPAASATTSATASTTTRESRTEPLSGLRKQIASNMQSAWRDIPHVFTFEEIDATALMEARGELNDEYERQGQRVSFLPFFVKACVIALQEHPRFNASLNLSDETVCYHGHCNIGIATATPEGLIVTVVHHAEQKSILDIGNEIASLAALARERRVSVDQIKGGTFTISNFGSYGGTIGTPIIRPPEVAIAGFGRIHEKVVPRNGEPAIRPILPLAVSTDHRLNDGEHLGGFVSSLTRLLSNPIRMLGHL